VWFAFVYKTSVNW